jgi:hypothetical protein
MKNTWALRIPAVFVFIVFTAAFVFGQAVNNAQIHGRVTDAGGAAVAKALVKVTQTASGLVRTATSDSEGGYSLPYLPVGPYQLEVSAPGFQDYIQKGIILQVGQDVQVDVSLPTGGVAEKIEVDANAEMVETRETSVSTVIDQRRIVDLPLNGRQASQLIMLSGAATNPPLTGNDLLSSKNYGNGLNNSSVAISVAGGQETSTSYLLDGGDHNDAFSNVNLPIPFPDALQEFSVQTSTLSASYGLHSGAVVNFVTKSGTNGFHGDAFEFLRNGAVNAKHFFTPPGKADDTLKRNQFGGTLGGPILKDKLMFFGGYQGNRVRQAPPTTNVVVPTAQVLAGDFSKIESAGCQSNGTARTIKDPVTKAPFPNSFVNPTRFNAQALALLNLVPITPDPCGRLNIGIPTTGDEDQAIGRVDWIAGKKQSIFGRYYIASFNDPAIYDGKNLLTTTKAGQVSRAQSLTLGDNYTLRSNMIDSLHITGTRLRIDRGSPANMPNFNDIGVNIPNPVTNAMVVSVTNYFNIASGTATPGHFNDNAFQIANDVQWVRGAHQVAFGVDWIHYQLNELSNFQSNGQFAFSGQATGDGLLDLLLGLPRTFAQGNPEEENWRQNYWGAYIQDSFRVRKNLTVNAGLRWEPYSPAQDKFHRGSHLDPALFAAGVRSQIFPNAPPGLFFCGDPQTPCAYTNRHLANFSPRFGVAWDPKGDGKQTIRAGYGLFYDNPEIFYFDRFADNSPYGSGLSLSSPAGGFTDPYQGLTVPHFPLTFPTSAATAVFPNAGVYVNVPLNLHPTYVQQWNLSMERQVGQNWLLSATYLGNKTTHLWIGYEANPAVFIPGTCGANPCSTTSNTNARRVLALINPTTGALFSSISQTTDGANASYNGLLLSANHRFSQNYTIIANYTYSHCISEGDFAGELSNSRLIQNSSNLASERGNCGFDRRHIFNISFVVSSPKFQRRFLQAVFGDWQLAGILTHYSGSWFSVLSGNDNSLSGVGKDRPNVVGNPNLTNPTVQQWFNTKAFVANAAGTFGNSGRDILEGPGFFTLDPTLSRNFRIREHQMLQLRWEAFNALNHPNFNNPVATFTSSQFGQITTTGDPRVMQIALKYVF